MFVCTDLRTEQWGPDFMPTPWTRLTCNGREIANALEGAEWSENPVQVVLCDACGSEGCSPGGYVHVSRLGEYVLWTAPQLDDEAYEPPYFLRSLGALAIPVETWRAWSSSIRDVLPPERFAPSNHAVVADAWILGPARAAHSIVESLRERLIGGDTMEKDRAIDLVERCLTVLLSRGERPFEQPLVSLDAVGGRLETLYFDGPGEFDWSAFACAGDETYIVLDREHIARIQV